MADYYTRTVITEPVLLTDELEKILSARGAQTYTEGEAETVLDGMIHERMPLQSYSVVWENGWTNPCDDVDEFLFDYAGWDEADVLATSEYLRKLVIASELDILREIQKLNPEAHCINMQSSWTCSKMRLDGFGGSGLILTKLGFLSIQTGHYAITDDGSICLASAFTSWEEYDEKVAERLAAPELAASK